MACNERFWLESEKHDLNMLYRLVGPQQPDGMFKRERIWGGSVPLLPPTSRRSEPDVFAHASI